MSDLTRTEIIDILLNEMECVQRASDDECNRDCAKCDLLRDTNKILQAYRIAIKALEHPEENVVKIIPHGDTISRQAAIKAITNTSGIRGDALNALYDLPPVNPTKTGHWIKHEHNGIVHIECSECFTWFLESHLLRNSYCPNCGCRMVEPQESEG